MSTLKEEDEVFEYYFHNLSCGEKNTVKEKYKLIYSRISDAIENSSKQILLTNSYEISLSMINSLFGSFESIDYCLKILSYTIIKALSIENIYNNFLQINVRISLAESYELPKEIKPEKMNSLVYFEGTVCRVNSSKPFIEYLIYECRVCKSRKSLLNDENRYKTPAFCRCKKYILRQNDPNIILKDIQLVKIRLKDTDEYIMGEIIDEKINSLLPGDNIRGIGIIRIGNESKGYFLTYLEINNFEVGAPKIKRNLAGFDLDTNDQFNEIKPLKSTSQIQTKIEKIQESPKNTIYTENKTSISPNKLLAVHPINIKKNINSSILIDDRKLHSQTHSSLYQENHLSLDQKKVKKIGNKNMYDSANNINDDSDIDLRPEESSNTALRVLKYDENSYIYLNKKISGKNSVNLTNNSQEKCNSIKISKNINRHENQIKGYEKDIKSASQAKPNINNDINGLNKSPNDYQVFCEMSQNKDIFSIIINTIYDDIYGYEEIKAGLLLGVVSGNKKNIHRGINVLLIGDPGLGKSKLLLKTSQIIPKTVYLCGNNTTTAGLTLSLTFDTNTNDYAVEAGAFILADNGVCLIDEFDKIPDVRALYEVLDDGNICYNKGGIYYSLKVNTSLIAATNPKFGCFDKNKTIKDNLSFDERLLSRFDLVFVMFDNYDIDKIQKILKIQNKSGFSKFLNKINNKKTDNLSDSFQDNCRNSGDTKKLLVGDVQYNHTTNTKKFRNNVKSQFITKFIKSTYENKNSDQLKKYSKANSSEEEEEINNEITNKILNITRNDHFLENLRVKSDKYDIDLICKYILYCKENITPILSRNAKKTLKEYYMEMRLKHDGNIRLLKSLILLTEAYSKINMRGVSTESDAHFIVDLHKRIQKNKTAPKKKKFMDLLKDMNGLVCTKTDIEDMLAACESNKNVDSTINRLNVEGILIKVGSDKYKINI
ncbi:hypothetical protein EDEG_01809 [Edhazardia aedis USNM 41457]|uniref:DNA helicase n=1 Tax=Edhazardia aedis (strain USNM 41457) TaxID=1003232 RepID=J9D8Q9_EDHAE|nr:hypothetical protein EDEG_01809 [Edhazardia aedis USNM 41457]|eukprot:EJW03899.1 hypothetical protein EDEG_01809 [Edhazardia aedis USNM 41457]